MRILYTSDIHADRNHLFSMLGTAAKKEVDAIIIGGDLVPHHLPGEAEKGVVAAQADYLRQTFLPTVSEYFSKNDLRGFESLFKSTSKWIFLVVLPIFIFILIFPKEILTLLYGSSYTSGYLALIIITFGIAANDFSGTAATILVAGGRTRANLVCEVIGAITNVALNIVLIPIYGIVGAAISADVAYAIYVGAHLRICGRLLGFSPRPLLRTTLNAALAGAALAGVLVLFGTAELSVFEWIGGAIAGALAFLAVLIVTGETSHGELRALASTVRSAARTPEPAGEPGD